VSTRRIFRYDPDIGHTYIPGIRARIPHESGGYLIECNQLGFRSSIDFKERKSNGCYRILLFGDSFTAGDGVSNQYRYSDLLASRLGRSCEVYNFGLSGSGTDQQFLSYQKFAANMDADLLVLGIYVENIRRNVAHYRPFLDADGIIRYYPKPWYALEPDGSLALHGRPVSRFPIDPSALPLAEQATVDQGGRFHLAREFVRKMGPNWKSILQKISRYQPLNEYGQKASRDWLLMSAIIREWVSSSPTPVVLFPIPVHQYVEETADPGPMRSRFHELATDVGCYLIDPLPDIWLASKEKRRNMRFETDPHLTKFAHRTLADSLSKGILQFFPL
jgi:hypothetical protein